MKRFIVTTTIHPPSAAIKAFSRMEGWRLIVVGDLRTPHHLYEELDCIYLHPCTQQSDYPELSRAIGWHCIQRRNIGFVEAYRRGADVLASVDDDNIPYAHWGRDLLVGTQATVDLYESETDVFDPLAVTQAHHLWHRGFPIEQLRGRRNVRYRGTSKRRVLVQADLWNGDPDICAIARITHPEPVSFDEITQPYAADTISPFDSQNTFFAREVIPYYAVFPFVGRMDDIWAGYFLQFLFPRSVVYNRPSVVQKRNPHDLVRDLEEELIGYRETSALLKLWREQISQPGQLPVGLPAATMAFYEVYRRQFSALSELLS